MNIRSISVLFLFFSLPFSWIKAQKPASMSSGQIELAISKMNTLGTVLYIAAHPDDENTRLLSYLANERKFRTVYLSLTRGDGGQNLVGKEQGAGLGMIRTQELLAARSNDGAEQYFTRANDFGYSKNPEETFSIWKKQEILSDVVWAIRLFKPDIIINRFPTTGEGGHGHHTASAILSLEAFKAAADPTQFPEQLKDVEVWQAKRVFLNSFTPRNQPTSNFEGQLKVDVGGYNPLLGLSYGEIAAESRSMHKSQGFGVARSRGTQIENFKKQDGDTMVTEIFENVDTTWKRVKGADELSAIFATALSSFDAAYPEKSIPQLVEALKKINKLEKSYWKEYKQKELQKIILACAGLWFEANANNFQSVPGDSLSLTLTAISRQSANIKIENISVAGFDTLLNKPLNENELLSIQKGMLLPKSTKYTTPFWLKNPHDKDAYVIDDLSERGEPWNTDGMKAVFTFIIENEKIACEVPISYKWTDPVKGELYRYFEVTPPVYISPSNEVILFTDGSSKTFQVKIKSSVDSLSGKIKFNLPEGYTITPIELAITILGKGKVLAYDFKITPSKSSKLNETVILKPWIEVDKNKFDYSEERIQYDHIPPMTRLSTCEVKLIHMDLKSNVKKVGYLEGAGDEVATCLRESGFEVTILSESDIKNKNLSSYGAIITGIRAYNTLENIDQLYDPLMNYVEEGGNLIVQYNTNNFLGTVTKNIGPYPFKISRDRVTVENAPVTFEQPKHPLLNHPNKITTADFDNWVQERGLYFATEIDSSYETILNWNDPGEKPLSTGLIICKKGKGNFIYTGISFFRQLPAGVPGAYRFMTNIINVGK